MSEIAWRLQTQQSSISHDSHKYRTSGSWSSGHCCRCCIAPHRLHLICGCGSLNPRHCRGKNQRTHFNRQKHKSDEASQQGLDTVNFTGGTKCSVVYPSDFLSDNAVMYSWQWPDFRMCLAMQGRARPADTLRVCHSNSPVSGAVRHSYKEVALTKPLATTELDCCVRARDSEAVVCLLTQHLPISAEALQNLHFLWLML